MSIQFEEQSALREPLHTQDSFQHRSHRKNRMLWLIVGICCVAIGAMFFYNVQPVTGPTQAEIEQANQDFINAQKLNSVQE